MFGAADSGPDPWDISVCKTDHERTRHQQVLYLCLRANDDLEQTTVPWQNTNTIVSNDAIFFRIYSLPNRVRSTVADDFPVEDTKGWEEGEGGISDCPY